jgi:hypothetical protein
VKKQTGDLKGSRKDLPNPSVFLREKFLSAEQSVLSERIHTRSLYVSGIIEEQTEILKV